MTKLFKLIGVGILSGITAKAGSMWMDYLFPKGFGEFFDTCKSKIKNRFQIKRG